MIVSSTGYGVLLTDDYGSAYKGYRQLVDIIRNLKSENYHEPKWVVNCPSAEDDQFILGFSLPITKNNDFKAADEKFKELLSSLPDNVKEILSKITLPEPDMHFMSGHC